MISLEVIKQSPAERWTPSGVHCQETVERVWGPSHHSGVVSVKKQRAALALRSLEAQAGLFRGLQVSTGQVEEAGGDLGGAQPAQQS